VEVTRVEWTRLDGGDVEAVVAMFVNREHVDSVRITPSRGDGGVDILDRNAGPRGGDAVYQVKRYTEPLSARQKAEVVKSLQALMDDPRWSGLNVTAWYLVTPWNPTPEAETWLYGLASGHGFAPVWRGLDHVEQLAAKYQDVVDYYLHGGRGRVEEAYKAVAALFAVQADGGNLDVPGVAARIKRALPVLDADPHYRYELRFGDGPLPEMPSRPNLVMTWLAADPAGEHWTAVDIIARCAASVEERPITVTGHFIADSGGSFETAYRDFVSYGTPFTSPEGAYRVEVDAPGGLGGRLDRATITTAPVPGDVGDNPQLHLEVLAPDGTVLAAADVDRTARSRGEDGFRAVLEEVHHVFTIEDRYNLTGMTFNRVLHLGDLTGQPVNQVRPALEFVRHCRQPNTGRTSLRHTPPELGTTGPTLGLEWSDETQRTLTSMFDVIDSLAIIQRCTPSVVRVPDLGAIPPGQAVSWLVAAKVLQGEDVTMTYPEGHCINVVLDTDVAAPEGEFGITVPMTVGIGNQSVDLGTFEVWLADPVLVQRRQNEGRMHYAFTTPDRTVRYHRPPPHSRL
jgi:hypothetical protein